MPYETSQLASAGDSCPEIHAAAVEHARPQRSLRWLDIGCGTGAVLREIRDRHAPSRLIGLDVIDWLDDDLRGDVELLTGAAEAALEGVEPVDRVLMVEVLEHLEAPWTVLRAAARKVAPGGRLVVTTPNVATLRHRLELLVRGQLTAFRPDNLPHLTPALPHVIERVLADEGLRVGHAHAGTDVVPLTGGRRWPGSLTRRLDQLMRVSLV
ncbi:MAG: class I SAM-dependent methyltransferase, partial [Thermoleophilaceae bacterium]